MEGKDEPMDAHAAAQYYQSLTEVEHVLKRPDTQLGSVAPCTETAVVAVVEPLEPERPRLERRQVTRAPALLKLLDELLVNAVDNKHRDGKDKRGRKMTYIKVDIDAARPWLAVENNGFVLPLLVHPQVAREDGAPLYFPEQQFGHLRTSSNYNDAERRITGGRNGWGSKLVAIFSLREEITLYNTVQQLDYHQVFRDNLAVRELPTVTPRPKKERVKHGDFTRVAFQPDLARFGLPPDQGLPRDVVADLVHRVYQVAGQVPSDVTVFLNGRRVALPAPEFLGYAALMEQLLQREATSSRLLQGDDDVEAAAEPEAEPETGTETEATASAAAAGEDAPAGLVCLAKDKRWAVYASTAPGISDFHAVSFVNGVYTCQNGTHVEYIANQAVAAVRQALVTGQRARLVSERQVRSFLRLYVSCIIENPAFTSQSKECLTTPAPEFGSACKLKPKALAAFMEAAKLEEALERFSQYRASLEMQRASGKKTQRMKQFPKLEDANWAGSRGAKAAECTLILCEGDSAKALAVAGFSVVGRDRYGVFPLRGVVLNVLDAEFEDVMRNQEINAIVRILGLQYGVKYDTPAARASLRYGRLLIMTDQDLDGSHIKGLVLVVFARFWPELLAAGYVHEFNTPLVRARKRGHPVREFFNPVEYERFLVDHDGGRGWTIKYYKGLGTSTKADAKQYFSNLDQYVRAFSYRLRPPAAAVLPPVPAGQALPGSEAHVRGLLQSALQRQLQHERALQEQDMEGGQAALPPALPEAAASEGPRPESSKEGVPTPTPSVGKVDVKQEVQGGGGLDLQVAPPGGRRRGKKVKREAGQLTFDAASDVDMLHMQFQKTRADDRKLFLQAFARIRHQCFLDRSQAATISTSGFVAADMGAFSLYANERTIPDVMDGLVLAQRKALWVFLTRRGNADIKVGEAMGVVSSRTAYHHGEQSMAQTIIGMAQQYVGANNISLLLPKGQFGTRALGGKDAASPRYIFTSLSSIARAIFPAADDGLLQMQLDDGKPIEPTRLLPVIPMALVNGGHGIGVGWKCDVPPHEPMAVLQLTEQLLRQVVQADGENAGDVGAARQTQAVPLAHWPLQPWYRGFTGEVLLLPGPGGLPRAVETRGRVRRNEDLSWTVEELPVQVWTDTYKRLLMRCMEEGTGEEAAASNSKGKGKGKSQGKGKANAKGKGKADKAELNVAMGRLMKERLRGRIKSFTEAHGNNSVSFRVVLKPEHRDSLHPDDPDLLDIWMLRRTTALTNMNMFNVDGVMHEFPSCAAMYNMYFTERLRQYGLRKQHLLRNLRADVAMAQEKARFITLVNEHELELRGVTTAALLVQMRKHHFLTATELAGMRVEPGSSSNTSSSSTAAADEESEDGDAKEKKERDADYAYLTRMPLRMLTHEHMMQLQAEAAACQASMEKLETTSPAALWLQDLQALREAMASYEAELAEIEGEDAAEQDGERQGVAKGSSAGKTKKRKPKVKQEGAGSTAGGKRQRTG